MFVEQVLRQYVESPVVMLDLVRRPEENQPMRAACFRKGVCWWRMK